MNYQWFIMRFKVFCLLLFVLSNFGCTPHDDKNAPDRVVVQLKYIHQAQFAGMYWAIENGYYEDENIEIQLKEGGGKIDLVESVVDGSAHFGIASSDQVLIQRSKGTPISAIAAIYRRSANVFVSKKTSGIERPHDMIGKKIAVFSENAKEYEVYLRAMLKKLELDIQEMTLVELDRDYKGFLDGDVDVTGAYITGGALRIESKGVELNYIWPSEYDINFYSDTIFTSDSLIKNNKSLVLRFLRATLRGWNEAVKNNQRAVDVTMKYAELKDRKLQERMMKAQHPLIYTGYGHIGWMEEDVWAGMNTILFEQGLIEKPIKDISSVYTNEFLKDIYQKEKGE